MYYESFRLTHKVPPDTLSVHHYSWQPTDSVVARRTNVHPHENKSVSENRFLPSDYSEPTYHSNTRQITRMYTTTKSKIYPTSLNPKDWEMILTNNSVKSAVSVPSVI